MRDISSTSYGIPWSRTGATQYYAKVWQSKGSLYGIIEFLVP